MRFGILEGEYNDFYFLDEVLTNFHKLCAIRRAYLSLERIWLLEGGYYKQRELRRCWGGQLMGWCFRIFQLVHCHSNWFKELDLYASPRPSIQEYQRNYLDEHSICCFMENMGQKKCLDFQRQSQIHRRSPSFCCFKCFLLV